MGTYSALPYTSLLDTTTMRPTLRSRAAIRTLRVPTTFVSTTSSGCPYE
jgi:hypothetical protein